MDQLDIFSLYPELAPTPELWDCMKTCKNCGIYMSRFPGTDIPRCDYGLHQPGIGVSGADMYQKVVDNIVHIYCKFYQPRAATAPGGV